MVISAAATATLESTENLSKDEWKSLIENLRINNTYPELLVVGFIEHIEPKDLPRHVQSVRTNGFYGYNIFPGGSRGEYAIVKYIEP